MRVAAIQLTTTADRDRNLATAARLVRAAAKDHALYSETNKRRDFPVRLMDGRVVSSLDASTVLAQIPVVMMEFVFVSGEWKKEAKSRVVEQIELTGVRGLTPVLFVQVKFTREPIANNRINISLPPKKMKPLARIPGPTYVVGVQEPTRRVFIRAVFSTEGPGVYNIPVAHELTPANLRILYDEVKDFWKNHDRKPQQSHFP